MNHHVSRRTLAALTGASLATLLACASAPPEETVSALDRPVRDTSAQMRDGENFESHFARRFPGVTLTQVDGGGIQIRIRGGSNSYYGSSEPLFVLDETPLPQGSGGVVFINPYDIQRIEVLKNPADTGIYGVRGGNGVVKITTKKPGRRR